jgi:curved DNA-binding protein CbpA
VSNFPEINPDDLEPTIDIDLQTQKRVLQLHSILETADHYQLLGVERSAEKKEIKNAYFALMNKFHADKFFGKNIGGFETRLQQIVQKLTKASDTLSRKKTKAEYDNYLASRENTLGARTSVAPRARSSDIPAEERASRPAVAPIDVIPQIPKAPRAPTIAEPKEPDSEKGKRPPSSDQVAAVSQRSPAEKREAAKRLLARKMGRRGVSAPARRSSPPPAADPSQVRRAVQEDLKKRYEARTNSGKGQVEKYVRLAEAAANEGDWAAAVNSIKMASQAAPDDPDVARKTALIQEQADRSLAPKFLEQAKYEEKDGHYERAARSYERAARGKNSASLFEKSALCLLKLGRLGDEGKRKVVELARKSVTLDNRSADYRLTLAKAYDVAGMRTSAEGEVRRALELEPNNKDAKDLQKALKS